MLGCAVVAADRIVIENALGANKREAVVVGALLSVRARSLVDGAILWSDMLCVVCDRGRVGGTDVVVAGLVVVAIPPRSRLPMRVPARRMTVVGGHNQSRCDPRGVTCERGGAHVGMGLFKLY